MGIAIVPPDEHLQHLRALVQRQQERGRTVLVVSVTRPYASLHALLATDGLRPDGIRYLDAITCLHGTEPMPRDDVRYIRSPTMLEMIAVRAEQMADPDCVVIVDSLNALAIYNGAAPVHEFAHFLANRLRQADVDGVFIVAGTTEGRRMAALLADVMDDAPEVTV